jgi:hypothetical protein
MALMSILPAIGPAVVWVPTAIILILNGSIVSGIVLIAIGMFVIGLVDNLLRPVLVGRDTRMPDYLVLLSTLGGLTAFGLAGIVIGPIIAAFFLSCWHMAREEFGETETLGAAKNAPDAAAERSAQVDLDDDGSAQSDDDADAAIGPADCDAADPAVTDTVVHSDDEPAGVRQ